MGTVAQERGRNARFWEHTMTGLVRITLKPGQELTYSVGRTDDEGWRRECTTWRHTGEGVEMEYQMEARDCDGRMSTGHVIFAPLDRLSAGYHDQVEGIRFPVYLSQEVWQRDHQAEAAGY